MEDDTSDVLNPPPYSNASDGPLPPQYQPYYNPPGARTNNEPVFQTSQTIVITHGQPISEPDYMAYSIFTILCCCLPLGIAALVYSVKVSVYVGEMSGENASGIWPYSPENSQQPSHSGHESL
uniref:Uncharacterized protein n=1 Tax=Anolis carolinensis TaxID=28377 RepID=A0A803STP6_ANOCA